MNRKQPDPEKVLGTLLVFLGEQTAAVDRYSLLGSDVFDVRTRQQAGVFGVREKHALTHLFIRLVDPTGEKKVTIDFGGENREKVETLQNRARAVAARAKELRYDVEMEPMNSYERMVVHEALKDVDGVKTESRGDGSLRHVVVRGV